MKVIGFNTSVPDKWNRWWLMMWAAVTTALLVSASFLRFDRWALATVIGFGIPEAISLIKRDDAYPLSPTLSGTSCRRGSRSS